MLIIGVQIVRVYKEFNRETRRASKQALNHGFILKKMYRVIRFHQKAWLKLYLDMNIK